MATKSTLLLLRLSILAWSIAALEVAAAQQPILQFYTDGISINGWTHAPERSYAYSWHFAKANAQQAGWSQELAVKYYNKKDIYYYDVGREGEFKGVYNPDTGKYSRLAPQLRRRHLEQIRPEWFQELDDMPFIRDMFKRPCEPFATSGARLEEPPTPPEPPKEWLDKHPGKAR